ncbi:MAG: hypothetical protein CVV04_12250 [Firmicutes bacterium HGW-Firmicutes-9]|jgi:hypothetical protein|nr:MAG: hypothetical protein CVV04_12250 [Firmicutes bacterium HGW-Firmicutes-9]
MQATAVCKRLLDLSLSRARSGTVHSVFDHAVNLEFGFRGLIGLIAEDKALTPYAVSVRTNAPFARTGVRADMAAYLGEGMLVIPDAQIEIDLSSPAHVELSVDAIEIRHREAPMTLLLLIEQALKGADAEMSLAPLVTGGAENTYTRFLAPRLKRLFYAVSLGAGEEAAQAAANCAGCGMGLTPSSDDLLSGYFTTLHLLFRAENRPEDKAIISNMAQAAAEKTNRISGTFLLHSGMALANTAICDLDRSIFTFMDQAAANRAIARVLAIGSTSGADMLTGMALALRQHIGGNET